ncbi:kinase-like protein [Panus rudis PR-1116 ss-1]|nr:kinase-like protein [Panus rudis PR-1116 ss-1]
MAIESLSTILKTFHPTAPGADIFGLLRIKRPNSSYAEILLSISVGPTIVEALQGLSVFLYEPDSVYTKFEFAAKFGQGGYGKVYIARQRATGQLCVVKAIQRTWQTPTPEKEANIIAKSKHPHIVGIFGAFETANLVHIAMELVPIGSLSLYLKETSISPGEDTSRDIIAQVNSALLYLHARGVAHRDIKPENVFCFKVKPKMVVKLTDFGLAEVTERIDPDARTTRCGTLSYMAPELHSGLRNYNTKIDMWSLGVMMFFLLSFSLPFDVSFGPVTIQMYNIRWHLIGAITDDARSLIGMLLHINVPTQASSKTGDNHYWLYGANRLNQVPQ